VGYVLETLTLSRGQTLNKTKAWSATKKIAQKSISNNDDENFLEMEFESDDEFFAPLSSGMEIVPHRQPFSVEPSQPRLSHSSRADEGRDSDHDSDLTAKEAQVFSDKIKTAISKISKLKNSVLTVTAPVYIKSHPGKAPFIKDMCLFGSTSIHFMLQLNM